MLFRSDIEFWNSAPYSKIMDYSLSDHAGLVISERGIKLSYIEQTLETPSLIAEDRVDKDL